ncbi:hypothetical protein [Mycobacterium sp. M23085]|uniref:hypothetical protein n=1 Tax=Mycobacterium sp. M23085 TaxID=3378087 RepID=UPI0038783262
MKLKPRDNVGFAAWGWRGRVQIQLAGIRFTATPTEAVAFASELIAAVDAIKADTVEAGAAGAG